MKIDIGEVVTILCVTAITIVAILALEGGGTEVAAAGLGGLVGYLTKANNQGGSNATQTFYTAPSRSGTDDS